MFKFSKKADYGLIAVKHLATHRGVHACSAGEISEEYGISATLMAKVLQRLARHGVVAAKHGSSVREPLRRVNESILHVLSTVTISQMSEDPHEPALVELRT